MISRIDSLQKASLEVLHATPYMVAFKVIMKHEKIEQKCFLNGNTRSLKDNTLKQGPERNQFLQILCALTFICKIFQLKKLKQSKQLGEETNRKRHKSAPYLRLKNSTKTSKCLLLSSTVPEIPKNWTELARRRDPFGFFYIHSVAKYQNNWRGDPMGILKVFRKMSDNTEQNWQEDPSVSPGIVCYAEKRNNFYSSVGWAKWSNLAP